MKKVIKVFILVVLLLIPSYRLANNYKNFYEFKVENKETDYDEKKKGNDIKEEEYIENPKIVMLAAGDIMFHVPQIEAASFDNGLDFSDNFRYVKKHIESSDIAVANLETTISVNDQYSGYPTFKSPEEILKFVKKAGFDGLTTTNNHIYDIGIEGFNNTIDKINENGLFNIGTSKEENGDKYIIKEINGIKVGMISYTYAINTMDENSNINTLSKKINFINDDLIKKDLELLDKENVDIKVVFLHWGTEYDTEPSESQRELSRKIVNWGGDIIFGSHPHVVQESEIIKKDGKNKFVVYSLGNFISNQRREILGTSLTEDGLMIKIELEKDLSSNETLIKDILYIPTWVRKYKKDNKDIYEILPVEDFIQDDTLNNILNETEKIKINESYENTINKMKMLELKK